MRKIILALGLISVSVFFNVSLSIAETIYLKSGKVQEGKIIEKTDKYIKIEIVSGVGVTYYLDDLEKIEDTQPIATTVASTSPEQSETQEGLYMSKEQGFSIRMPKEWFKRKEGVNSGIFRIAYAKYKEPLPVMDLPVFSVTALPPHPFARTPIEIASQVFSQWKSKEEKYEIAESPKEIEINGMQGASFSWDKPAWDKFKNQEFWVRITSVYVIGNNKVLCLTLFSRRDEYDATYKEIHDSIKSLTLISGNLDEQEKFSMLKGLAKMQLEFKPIAMQLYDSLKTQVLSMQTKNTYQSLFVLKDRAKEKLAGNNFIAVTWFMTYISPRSFEIIQSDYYHNEMDIWRVVGDEIYIKIGSWMPMPTQAESPGVVDMIKTRKEIYKMASFIKYLELLQKETPVGIMENVQDKYTVLQFKPQQIEDLWTGKPREGFFVADESIWIDNEDKTIRFVRTTLEGKDKEGKEIKQEYEHYFDNYDAPFKLGNPEMQ